MMVSDGFCCKLFGRIHPELSEDQITAVFELSETMNKKLQPIISFSKRKKNIPKQKTIIRGAALELIRSLPKENWAEVLSQIHGRIAISDLQEKQYKRIAKRELEGIFKW